MVGMNPGEFRDRVEFWKDITEPDGYGGRPRVRREMLFSMAAKVVPDKAYYSMENDRLQMEIPLKLTIRYAAGRIPTVDLRARYRGESYRILSITDVDNTRRYIDLRIIKEG